jgi:DNA-binding MarR family transcriptional regulator
MAPPTLTLPPVGAAALPFNAGLNLQSQEATVSMQNQVMAAFARMNEQTNKTIQDMQEMNRRSNEREIRILSGRPYIETYVNY